MKNIGLFCSASENISPVYFQKAHELGKWLGENKKTLIYGGVNLGLMECVASEAREYGATIIGVVPFIMEERGKTSDLLDVTFKTENLSERKDIILRESDIMIALPGGIGTLDELFHVMASSSLDYHHKKIIFYNIDGFWNDLISFLNKLERNNFSHRTLNNYYTIANTFEELTEIIK